MKYEALIFCKIQAIIWVHPVRHLSKGGHYKIMTKNYVRESRGERRIKKRQKLDFTVMSLVRNYQGLILSHLNH